MKDNEYRELTASEKLELAQEINALIDQRYPLARFAVEPDVLLLALMSRTSSSQRQSLGIGFH